MASMALQSYQYHHDLLEEAFLADIGFGLQTETETETLPSSDAPSSQDNPVATSPEDDTSSGSAGTVASASGAGDDGGGDRDLGGAGDDDRRLRRKILNRESARRSRARKQRHLDEQRAAVALLRASNRDLAERLRGARARNTLVELANARLRAEGAALGRRLSVARRALALRQLYAAGSAGLDVQTLASLIS